MTTPKAKVLEWLKKEGYPLEYQTAHTFIAHDWFARQGEYSSHQGENPREIDVLASIVRKPHDHYFSDIRIQYVVECKYSKGKPWVVLTSPLSKLSPSAVLAQSCATPACAVLLSWLRDEEAVLGSPFFRHQRDPGFGGVAALGGRQDVFFNAVRGTVERAQAVAAAYGGHSFAPGFDADVRLVLPLVVVEGDLFEASFHQTSGELLVDDVPWSRIHWRGAGADTTHTFIDIVQASHLASYVRLRSTHAHDLLERLVEAIKVFDHALVTRDDSKVASAVLGIGDSSPKAFEVVSKFLKEVRRKA